MSTYAMGDGTVLKSELAAQSWKEATWWNGSNHISVPTGSQWHHETLHHSAKGRYWIERTSEMESFNNSAKLIEPLDAVRWLISNNYELPVDLAALEAEVAE